MEGKNVGVKERHKRNKSLREETEAGFFFSPTVIKKKKETKNTTRTKDRKWQGKKTAHAREKKRG